MTTFAIHYWNQYNKEVDSEQITESQENTLETVKRHAAHACDMAGHNITFTVEIYQHEVIK